MAIKINQSKLAEIKAIEVREIRDSLIRETDWTQLPDVPGSVSSKWLEYRQALRDITEQKGFPSSIVWPEKPT